jgi:hypothetical protein
MSNRKITAKISKVHQWKKDKALLVEATDGRIYIRYSEWFRGEFRDTYSSMPTIVDLQARSLADNVDKPVAWGRMPKAVRDLMSTTR